MKKVIVIRNVESPTFSCLSMRASNGRRVEFGGYDVLVDNIMVKKGINLKTLVLSLLTMGFSVSQIAYELDYEPMAIERIVAENSVNYENLPYEDSYEDVAFDEERSLELQEFGEGIPVVATIYHAVPSQTDSTPFITADGTRIKKDNVLQQRILAVSRDLLVMNGGHLRFGDAVYVQGADMLDGIWYVHDVMHHRFNNRVDFLVPLDIRSGKWHNVMITPLSENMLSIVEVESDA